jgi:hypothetical protein
MISTLRKSQSLPMRLTLRNQDEKGNAWSLANDQIWREPAARALRDVQTLRTNGTVDIATVAALLFVLAKKTCLLAVSTDFIGEIDSNNHFGFHAGPPGFNMSIGLRLVTEGTGR